MFGGTGAHGGEQQQPRGSGSPAVGTVYRSVFSAEAAASRDATRSQWQLKASQRYTFAMPVAAGAWGEGLSRGQPPPPFKPENSSSTSQASQAAGRPVISRGSTAAHIAHKLWAHMPARGRRTQQRAIDGAHLCLDPKLAASPKLCVCCCRCCSSLQGYKGDDKYYEKKDEVCTLLQLSTQPQNSLGPHFSHSSPPGNRQPAGSSCAGPSSCSTQRPGV